MKETSRFLATSMDEKCSGLTSGVVAAKPVNDTRVREDLARFKVACQS